MSVPTCTCSSAPGELQTLPRTPCPGSLPAPGGQDRGGTGTCCFGGCAREGRMLLPVWGHKGPALPRPSWPRGVSLFLLQAGCLGASPQEGLVWSGVRHWSPTGLGQGSDPSVPEFPGGEQEGAGLCRDCLEQGRSTQGRPGAGWGHTGHSRGWVGAHRAEQVLGASASHSCLSQKPPQQHRLLQGCCAHSNPV